VTTPRVLIVADEAISARAARVMLARIGCSVIRVVDTGEGAIEAAEQYRPEIVLMDIRLKGAMNSIEASAIIHERLGTPIVFVTTYSKDDLRDAGTLPADAIYLSKPIDEGNLATAIDQAIARR
jgi:CheY-like chemotaxis protein